MSLTSFFGPLTAARVSFGATTIKAAAGDSEVAIASTEGENGEYLRNVKRHLFLETQNWLYGTR